MALAKNTHPPTFQRAHTHTLTKKPPCEMRVVVSQASDPEHHSLDLEEESCVPLRPSYAADLRNASLVVAGYDPSKVVSDQVDFTFQRNFACEVAYNSPTGTVFRFPDPNPIVMPINSIVEWKFNDLVFHPLHVSAYIYVYRGARLQCRGHH